MSISRRQSLGVNLSASISRRQSLGVNLSASIFRRQSFGVNLSASIFRRQSFGVNLSASFEESNYLSFALPWAILKRHKNILMHSKRNLHYGNPH